MCVRGTIGGTRPVEVTSWTMRRRRTSGWGPGEGEGMTTMTTLASRTGPWQHRLRLGCCRLSRGARRHQPAVDLYVVGQAGGLSRCHCITWMHATKRPEGLKGSKGSGECGLRSNAIHIDHESVPLVFAWPSVWPPVHGALAACSSGRHNVLLPRFRTYVAIRPLYPVLLLYRYISSVLLSLLRQPARLPRAVYGDTDILWNSS